MTISHAYRILSDQNFRPAYRAARRALGNLVGLTAGPHRPFARYVTKDLARFLLGRTASARGATRERAQAAAAWLMRAQDATPDGGVSYGYFPNGSLDGDWKPSYPETTGYIIPTLLDYARRYGDPEAHERALRMARWEIDLQMPSGAVQGGMVCPASQQTPAVFNTGMVLQGFTAAYRASGDESFRDAGRRAADFLVADLGPDGHFRTHGQFVTQDRIKTYNCLCSWALYRFGEDAQDERYQDAALRSVEAAVAQQQPNGWFASNCLERPEAPLTHTIGYALQGILEVGILAGREDWIASARRGTDPLVARLKPSGFLPGRFDADWQPASFSSCLTGSAQIAVVCYRLFGVTGDPRYRDAADRLTNFVKALQVLDSPIPGIKGAVAGSFPMLGSYQIGGYPNWATKYFLDALMEQDRLETA